jgi:Anti-sigma-K factor rskA, C-terminal
MKTDRPHELIEELIAAEALDGLDAAERDRLFREMAAHGPDCPDCARLLAEYGEVAGWLALALDPVPLSADAEARLFQAVRGEPETSPEGTGGQPPTGGSAGILTLPERSARTAVGRWRRWVAAASVAAVLAGVAGAVGWAIAPRGSGARSQFLAFVAEPGTEVATLAADKGRSLAVAFHPGQREAWVIGTGLPDPQGGKVYELWYRTGTSTRMEPAGTFSPEDGTVLAKVHVGSALDALAVSVEPQGGSKQPTSSPIYLVSV